MENHYQPIDYSNADQVKKALLDVMVHEMGRDPESASSYTWYNAVAEVVRRKTGENLVKTAKATKDKQAKQMFYLSMEYLLGQSMYKRLTDLGLEDVMTEALSYFNVDINELIYTIDSDAALGNGGLGRLAACFLDSIATHAYPAWGYGLRYDYGMFVQDIDNGMQSERPETWLRFGNPWEFARPGNAYTIQFGGQVVEYTHTDGGQAYQWINTENVLAVAYDMPITGFQTDSAANLRLWSAKSPDEFNLASFNTGNYVEAVADKVDAETLTKVLYPNDNTQEGKSLRLRQEYFFVGASLQDILGRHKKEYGSFDNLADKVAIQLNDTHPSLAVPELMRLLMDEYEYGWDKAWEITTKTISYTNHTLLPEALETWSIQLMEENLPRHLQIIYTINERFLTNIRHQYPGNTKILQKLSLIDDNSRSVRMAHLAIVGSHKVNGVAALHSELLKRFMFPEFNEVYPNKFVNETNGVTPRRWLYQSNKELSGLISDKIGQNWVKNLHELRQLEDYIHDADFRAKFAEVKKARKVKLAQLIQKRLNITINPDALIDTQVKRIHEYKRQLLNILHVITRYNEIKDNPEAEFQNRVVVFAGKAAPGYFTAKKIIALINDVADTVNNDTMIGDKLKVVFIPNYNVSQAEIIIPGSDLSEQISTAGTEASGTGNMKFALNGALTIGTLDGANVEIKEEVGDENIFIFGMTTDEVEAKRKAGYNPYDYYNNNPALKRALDMIRDGFFNPHDVHRYQDLFNNLTQGGDYFMLLADYQAYIDCQKQVENLYKNNREEWISKSILNVARIGKFSSDRTIHGYCQDIWNIQSLGI
ncbi:MAG: glycogen/starch/alpha-glucan phosphorylase [Alphaproteobacteria bacterium]